jgi:formylglycine-generating enzyme required for sulfatase activity
MSDARLRNLERELLLEPARMDLHAERARLLDRAGRADESLAALDLAWRLGRFDLEAELRDLLEKRKLVEGSLTLRYVPAGPFCMGSETGDSDESPRHLVTLSAFYVAQRPLRWSDVETWSGLTRQEVEGLRWTRDQPVSRWTYDQALAGLAGLSQALRPGRPAYRLPTEAQWERVRRAGLLTPGRNPYGVDLGRAPEWTADHYDSISYTTAPRVDPAGPDSGEHRVVRGPFDAKLPFVRRATYRESAAPTGELEAVAKALRARGSEATRLVPPVEGIELRASVPA